MSALELYGCGRLASRINEIRKLGYEVKTEMVAFTKKSGRVGKYGLYSIVKWLIEVTVIKAVTFFIKNILQITCL